MRKGEVLLQNPEKNRDNVTHIEYKIEFFTSKSLFEGRCFQTVANSGVLCCKIDDNCTVSLFFWQTVMVEVKNLTEIIISIEGGEMSFTVE